MDKDFIQGECDQMCPLMEVRHRSREKLVHFYEKDGKYVKQFSRSAAGQKVQKAHELRTEKALRETVRYLLMDIAAVDKRKPYHYMYDFIFDRLRCVRQEIVIQNLSLETTVKLLEPIIAFLAYSRYRLADETIHNFDPKICEQHLQECLKKILVCYDHIPESKYSENRCIIEAIYLIFNLESSEAPNRGIKLPKSIKRDAVTRLALKISLNVWQKNYYGAIKLIKNLPTMLFAVASLKLNHIRRQILLTFTVAYNSKQLSVPIDYLTEILMYEEKTSLIDHLKYYGIEYNAETQSVKFEKKFDNAKAEIPASTHAFVDRKFDCDKFETYFLLN